jgi:serine phosphatase RsbU (regulator of sigma subunit)
MLPPGTAGTHRVVVSGLLEPGSEGADDAAGSGHDDRGGDAFDYALSATRAQVALLDAGAGRLQGPLAAATSLAAYRTARRRDASLVQQAEAIQRALTARFEPGAHAGGVLADLDAASGRLRYVAAGRVSALLVRAGAVAKHLDGGRGPRLGLGAGATAVGAEQLEPGDTVVLCTDGVTEVRDDQQRQLGPDRLADALHRAFAESLPLPEVVRRVVDAVVAHRRGPLQEDATVVALQWTTLGQASLGPRLLAAAGRP